MIGLPDISLLKRSEPEVVIIKELSSIRNKLFHVCDTYDVVSVKLYKDESRKDLEEEKETDQFNPLTTHQTLRSHSILNFMRSDVSYEFSRQKLEDDRKEAMHKQELRRS